MLTGVQDATDLISRVMGKPAPMGDLVGASSSCYAGAGSSVTKKSTNIGKECCEIVLFVQLNLFNVYDCIRAYGSVIFLM
jgi:hypothetical protein